MIQDASWARTALGKPIALYASFPLEKMRGLRPILLVGGVHGDEPEGVWLAEGTLAFLEREPQAVRVPWVLIPCLNEDGIAKGQRGNGRGVDLNRNYPARNWSPAFEKERYHPGPSPGSEPETQAVVKLIETLRPRLLVHCHSW
jgi:predicted deacylase